MCVNHHRQRRPVEGTGFSLLTDLPGGPGDGEI